LLGNSALEQAESKGSKTSEPDQFNGFAAFIGLQTDHVKAVG
jgi:hypothetical protein